MHPCCSCCTPGHTIGHMDPCPRHQRGAPRIRPADPKTLPPLAKRPA